MAFDQTTRNRLARFVNASRDLLTKEFTRQLQNDYGMNPDTGEVAELDRLTHLDDSGSETARLLRETMAHYLTNETSTGKKGSQEVLTRIVREQAFTVLNRICALRMGEARGVLIESVARGYQSQGFELYANISGSALGERGETYSSYLLGVLDEYAIDLPVLFDRFSSQGRLFPREAVLLDLLNEVNDPEIDALWAEDETIGWIYQYFNTKEERKSMRDASSAPRNSRELAVRNQFFTPRYVVEFLTDNTLGRIWYEMTKGQTRLVDQCCYLVRRPTEIFLGEGEAAPDPPEGDTEEALSQEELLQQPVHIPHRPVKDPREIRLLDPACGSMHFGLYAFDLFEAIYEEAWDKGLCPALQEAYPSKDDYLRDVPRLIIEHNIHGVDIDPRAVQIAGLSLWLRAQKTWKDTPATERPRVHRSNIVCAEPMPGSDAMLEDFVRTLDPPLLGELVKTVFDKMQLAGEAGTLLKIEEEIRTGIDEARQAWEKLQSQSPGLFSTDEINRVTTQPELPNLDAVVRAHGSQLSGDFFDNAEERIYVALRDYAESATAGDYQRQLFVEDAAHGFAFIDLCRKRYDAVVMNPPFGEDPKNASKYIKQAYQFSQQDIAYAFTERAQGVSLPKYGLTGAITTRTGFFLSSLTDWREQNLSSGKQLQCCADLGYGVLDALVETAAYVIENGDGQSAIFFIDVLDSKDKERLLLEAIQSPNRRCYLADVDAIKRLPGTPFAYWPPSELIHSFAKNPGYEPRYGSVKRGVATGDNDRFLRLFWEPPYNSIAPEKSWIWYAKGGEYSPYFISSFLVLRWAGQGRELRNFTDERGKLRSRPQNLDSFFLPGLAYASRTTSGFAPRVLPADHGFDQTSNPIVPNDNFDKLASLAIFLTRPVLAFIELAVGGGATSQSGTAARDYTNGLVGKTPVPSLSEADQQALASMVTRIVDIARTCCSSQEVLIEFVAPRSCMRNAPSMRIALREALADEVSIKIESLDLSFEIDRIACVAFNLSQSSVEFLDEFVGRHPNSYCQNNIDRPLTSAGPVRQETKKCYWADQRLERLCHSNQLAPAEAAKDSDFLAEIERNSVDDEARAQASFALGCAMGRWDIRYATGERQPPELPDPFDPLPVCPPGMLQDADGLPAAPADVPDEYPLRISWPGIIVDDDGHPADIVVRVRDALAVIWDDRALAIEQEACDILGVRSLRDYFAEKKTGGKFFKDHLKRYSKSSRQAPIYWPLSTESGTYTLWIYYHRLDDQTLYTCVNDFIEPRLKQVTDEATQLRGKQDRSSAEETDLERVTDLAAELHEFRDQLLEVAKIWKPNLNDGVQITAAPLWRFFLLRKWQTTLRQTWEKLEAGDCDWAHLALSIWPDRVVRTSYSDRSVAIAHDLEKALWEEVETKKKGKGGKARTKLEWRSKELSEDELDQIIAEVRKG